MQLIFSKVFADNLSLKKKKNNKANKNHSPPQKINKKTKQKNPPKPPNQSKPNPPDETKTYKCYFKLILHLPRIKFFW